MENNHYVVSGGVSLFTIGVITGIVLCVLQGVGVFDIGWFWATFPFWIAPAAYVAIVIVILIVAVIVGLINLIIDKRR